MLEAKPSRELELIAVLLFFLNFTPLCQALSSSRSNKADLFMLRSLAHGRIGAFEEAVADAEAALKEREDDPSVSLWASVLVDLP